MSAETLRNDYQARLQAARLQAETLSRKLGQLSLARLLAFVGALAFLPFLTSFPAGGVLSALLLILFGWLVNRHRKMAARYALAQKYQELYQQELDFLDGNFLNRPTGLDLLPENHPFAADIDLLGTGSIYQYLNRTVTHSGARRLADWLLWSIPTERIPRQQEAARQLAQNPALTDAFRAQGLQADEKPADQAEILVWLAAPTLLQRSAGLMGLLYGLPGLALLVLIGTVIGLLPWQIFLGVFLLNLGVTSQFRGKTGAVHAPLARKNELLGRYGTLMGIAARQQLQAERLNWVRQQLGGANVDTGVEARLRKLAGLVQALDTRFNAVAFALLNGLLLWDIRFTLAVEEWRTANRGLAQKWFDALAEFDALTSLALFHHNHPDFAFPEVSETGPVYEAVALGHPLIPSARRVNNDFLLEKPGQLVVLTGSNMAGKSTFLRAVGVNLALARAGAAVCAARYRCRPMALYSSMRIADSLLSSTSTFFAELRRLQGIVEALRRGESVFVLLDEILRGTNSADKLKGSVAFLRQLAEFNATGLIATHDIDLARLAENQPEIFRNMKFEIELKDDTLVYDYKLKPGVCQTMNATHLMRQMGLGV